MTGFLSIISFLFFCSFILIVLHFFNLLGLFTSFSLFALILWLSWHLRSFLRHYSLKTLVSSSGKAVLITGCDSGFGLTTAKVLHLKGFRVIAVCLSDKSDGALLLNKLNIRTMEMDVRDEEQIKNVKINVQNHLKETNTELWALVNNAGVLNLGFIEWGDISDLKKLLDVNVIGLAQVTKHFLPLIRQSKGRVVNIASSAGRFAFPNLGFYSMSKHAVIAFSDALRLEMLDWNVNVITVEPMAYKTSMSDQSRVVCSLTDVWQRTPYEVKSDYGENFFHAIKERMCAITHNSNPNVHEVVNSVVDAVTNINPKIRYTCADTLLNIFWWIMETLPKEITDYIFWVYFLFMVKPRALDSGF